ncbi:PREDICTED: uncharacterized protein LOC109345965 isoform X2 [Lupinus angustifolius]|uniref:uncharacterized protein LOC109345965 isoform X2 n=1 Tax=Lupinus angustifolius TaxID=3871 RepID=UPI00092FD23F|nr:PREDICTED: uncharacterized protein LOC109345965 isoform X2 [Lupinus angustifolius]
MFSPSNLKTMHPLQVFSSKSSSSSFSSTLSSMKLKNLIHTLIVSHIYRIIRALTKVKDVIVEILKDNNSTINFSYLSQKKYYNKRKHITFGSFRFHYNWCSSKSSHISDKQVLEDVPDLELARYLRWLEEKVEDGEGTKEKDMNEIDMLAEMFIANCHEKFRLEKQESDRRFQEMLARSI